MKVVIAKLSLTVALLIAVAGAQAAPKLAFSPDKQKAAVGEHISVQVEIQEADSVDGGGFDLVYDPALIEIVSVSFDDRWEFKTVPGQVDAQAGRVNGVAFATYSPVSSSVRIATVTVKTLSKGHAVMKTRRSSKFPFAVAGSEVEVAMAKSFINIK